MSEILVFAHNGGIDEVLWIAAPALIALWALRRANRASSDSDDQEVAVDD